MAASCAKSAKMEVVAGVAPARTEEMARSSASGSAVTTECVKNGCDVVTAPEALLLAAGGSPIELGKAAVVGVLAAHMSRTRSSSSVPRPFGRFDSTAPAPGCPASAEEAWKVIGARDVTGDSVMTPCEAVEGERTTRIGGRAVSNVERVADSAGTAGSIRTSLVGEPV